MKILGVLFVSTALFLLLFLVNRAGHSVYFEFHGGESTFYLGVSEGVLHVSLLDLSETEVIDPELDALMDDYWSKAMDDLGMKRVSLGPVTLLSERNHGFRPWWGTLTWEEGDKVLDVPGLLVLGVGLPSVYWAWKRRRRKDAAQIEAKDLGAVPSDGEVPT